AQSALEGLAQHEARLGHRAFGRIDEKEDAVGHLEHALDLAAEVRVTGRVDQVDLHTVPGKRDILRENGDAALPLEIVRVEDALPEVLVARDRAGLPEEAVDHGRLPVVDMRNDGDVSDSIEGGAVSWHQRCSRDLHSALKRKGTN